MLCKIIKTSHLFQFRIVFISSSVSNSRRPIIGCKSETIAINLGLMSLMNVWEMDFILQSNQLEMVSGRFPSNKYENEVK